MRSVLEEGPKTTAVELKSLALGQVYPHTVFFQAENNAFRYSSQLNNTRISSVSFAESFVFCVFHAASVFGGLLLRNPAGHQKPDMAEKKKAQEFIHLFLCNSP